MAYLLLGASFVDANSKWLRETGETQTGRTGQAAGQLRSGHRAGSSGLPSKKKKDLQVGFELGSFPALRSERVLESLGQTTARGLNDKAQHLGPQTPSFWWLYLQPGSVCGLPVIAFCLKKETVPRKRPITLPLWVNLSLLLRSPGLQWAGTGATPLQAGASPIWAHPLPFVLSPVLSPGIFCPPCPTPAIVWPSWDEAQSPLEEVSRLWGLLHCLAGPSLPSASVFLDLWGVSSLDHKGTRQHVNSRGLCLTRCSHCAAQSVYPMPARSGLFRKWKWWCWECH